MVFMLYGMIKFHYPSISFLLAMLYMLGSIKFFPNSQWFLNVVKRETMYSKKQNVWFKLLSSNICGSHLAY